eukprot:16427328-Heterocapsa_arctica.AAC.1
MDSFQLLDPLGPEERSFHPDVPFGALAMAGPGSPCRVIDPQVDSADHWDSSQSPEAVPDVVQHRFGRSHQGRLVHRYLANQVVHNNFVQKRSSLDD